MRAQRTLFGDIDLTLVFLYLALVFIGWISIYAAVYDSDHKNIFDFSQSYGKQLIFITSSFVIAACIMIIDSKFFSTFAFPIYILAMILLVAVLFFGTEISGSKSWFRYGEFGLQPAEFAKFATSLVIARFLSSLNVSMKNIRTKIIAFTLIAIPIGLILLENETGSALVFLSFILVLYREGLSGNVLILGLISILIFIFTLLGFMWWIIGFIIVAGIFAFFSMKRTPVSIAALIGIVLTAIGFVYSVDYVFENVLESHQKTRIDVILNKDVDLKGAGYNVNQSKIAIGSGGFWGKGFLQGTQTKYNFVPEQSTDFIFCTVGEEWGFLGSIIVMGLYITLLLRIIFIAERQRSTFSRIYGYGVASIIFFHLTINVGMTLGLVPVIGIPLPFLSYGGSSLWAFTILLFILIKQDSYRLQIL